MTIARVRWSCSLWWREYLSSSVDNKDNDDDSSNNNNINSNDDDEVGLEIILPPTAGKRKIECER